MNKLTQHHLTAEPVHDEHGQAIMLSQQEDGYDDPETIMAHPWQLRAICEHFNIMAAEPQTAKAIATLQRRMLVLRDRIDQLHKRIASHCDREHADLFEQLLGIEVLADLAREWCADFDNSLETETAGKVAAGQLTLNV